ncbi:hypothetical protein FEM48_Zijuj07G0021100 [Ziziphus jujuba var. spinosa]|uniref:Pentatricopeptide repeat-containing protein n=1 Tax=Ziziphus jujuba var. spinosa TaxID=714518 RepID=A0A978V1U3_ZIZJJ|nr:hypothetical protein FEM48_Zijuj07G0021100 [Ziziphus jujuba var. spinosa]
MPIFLFRLNSNHQHFLKPISATIGSNTAFFSTAPPPTTIPLITTTLLKQCKSLIHAKTIHQQILVQGLTNYITHLIGTYIAANAPQHAMSLLESLQPSPPTVFWWNALMRQAVRSGLLKEVLNLYHRMLVLGWKPDHYTFPFVLKACGYAQRAYGYEALNVFRKMQAGASKPNVVTLVSLLSGCASVGALLNGKETHCHAIKSILNLDGGDPGENLMVQRQYSLSFAHDSGSLQIYSNVPVGVDAVPNITAEKVKKLNSADVKLGGDAIRNGDSEGAEQSLASEGGILESASPSRFKYLLAVASDSAGGNAQVMIGEDSITSPM